jgi:hypothetical protein
MVNNSTKINKINNNLSPKEILNSEGQQFHQYQQDKLLILVELLTFSVKTFFRWEIIVCFVDIGRIVNHHCLDFLYERGFCLSCWYWWNCWPSLFKISLGERLLFILLILVELLTNNLSPEERLNDDGQQFHQYQQNKQ